MLTELRAERDRTDEAIMVIERLAAGQGRRRGRPPKWMAGISGKQQGRKRAPFSAETRARMAAAQKRRWAKTP